VRRALGPQYKNHFGDTPFALHTAPYGTTARLRGWFGSLAKCVNAGALEPMLLAVSFRVLDGPGTPLHSEGKFSFCMSRDFEQIPVTAAMFGSKFDVASIDIKTHVSQTPRGGGAKANSAGANGYSARSAAQAANSSQEGARTTADWLADQDQFSHLPPLPQGWIRVRSRTTGAIYYCCTETGETTFEEPTERRVPYKASDLPPGWVEMTSRTTGKTYYWNHYTQMSQFEKPTE